MPKRCMTFDDRMALTFSTLVVIAVVAASALAALTMFCSLFYGLATFLGWLFDLRPYSEVRGFLTLLFIGASIGLFAWLRWIFSAKC